MVPVPSKSLGVVGFASTTLWEDEQPAGGPAITADYLAITSKVLSVPGIRQTEGL